MPRLFRFGAIGLLAVTVLAIGVGFYRARNNPEFRMKGFPTSLSQDVVASINGYERREMDGDVVKYYIKADKATTFADNHLELENVFLQVFDDSGTTSDNITAQKAVYVPAENKNFTAYFAGDVNIQTRDSLNIKTAHLTYNREDETAAADEHITFERENVRGRSYGAIVKVREKRLELLRDVEVETFESSEFAKSNIGSARLNAGRAVYDQLNEKIELHDGVNASFKSRNKTNNTPQTADVRSARANVFLIEKTEGSRDVKKLELFDNVQIDTRQSDGKPTKINSGYALYEKDIDRFDLKNGVQIVTVEDETPTNIRSDTAIYEQSNGKIFLDGGAEITQGGDLLKGDHIIAELFANKKLKNSHIRGNAYLKQSNPERTTEISGNELNAAFNDTQKLVTATVTGTGTAVLSPSNPVEYSKVTLSAPKAINVFFKGDGLLERMQTDGRTTIQLDVPGSASDSANKRITADTVKVMFNANGKDLQKAEAVGNAELFVEPLRVAEQNYKTTINAPRFDCEFFPSGNNAKVCIAGVKTKTVRVPTMPAGDRGTQTIIADKLLASFNLQTKDVERMDASGGAKFTELERNAIADQISFTTVDETVRLRGGEPTVWDSRARAKAREIDWDTRNEKSFLRGGTSTTYYSQNNTGGATPFGKGDKPVYITADAGEFDHRAETGAYSGNARGWQENNYVRGDRLLIMQKQGQLHVDGNVQSLLYNAKRKENGKETSVPVYASAKKMTYNHESRILHYEKDVDIRQGTDRIIGGSANVFLTEKNEVARTDIETNVLITQPNRRASADFAQYVAADESVVLRGNPARVEDAESGSSQAGQMTVYLRENRIVTEGKSKQNAAGRTRSVYKIKNN